MKNKINYIFVGICICILVLVVIQSQKQSISNTFWDVIAEQFDKEEKYRIQKIENGDIIRGKDTVLIWENKFVIWKQLDEKRLSIEDNNISEVILNKIMNFKTIDERLYIISEYGCATIDKNNFCKIYIPSDITNYNDFGVQHVRSNIIQYLSEFSDFSEEEQEKFNEIKCGESI